MATKRSELELKLAQMFMVGFRGIELSPATEEFLRDYQPGGVIYFSCNYESPIQVHELSGSIQNLRTSKTLPMIISVDHEGGKVQRFKKPFTHFPEPVVLGMMNSPKLAFTVAEVMAKELRVVGVNLDFFPLCDIHTRANNPVIGRRAFGADPELVSQVASAVVRGFISKKMISCVKHFPGHGDTSVDSHYDLPLMNMKIEELEARELIPFARTIKSKADMIMTAHILNRELDPVYPATLSYSTLTNLLRTKMRFQKLIITDDLQMESLTKHWGEEDIIALSINAGADILLYRDEEHSRRAMDIAFKFLASGRIEAAKVEAAYQRIAEVKHRVLLPYVEAPVEDVATVVGCEEHQQVLAEVLKFADK